VAGGKTRAEPCNCKYHRQHIAAAWPRLPMLTLRGSAGHRVTRFQATSTAFVARSHCVRVDTFSGIGRARACARVYQCALLLAELRLRMCHICHVTQRK
jgi:hypothetical protein